VKKQFVYKYGKKFEEEAMANTAGVLNERVVLKLSVQPPSAFQVISYLRVIADEYGFEYDPDIDVAGTGAMAAPTGFSVPVAPGSGYGQIYSQPSGQPPELPNGWTYEAGLLAVGEGEGAGRDGTEFPATGGVREVSPVAGVEVFPPAEQLPPMSKEPEIPTAPSRADEDIVVPPSNSYEEEGEKEEGKGGDDDEEGKGGEGEAPNYDSLAARFDALNR